MATNNKNMNQDDQFNKLMKEKLAHHQIPVDDALWRSVEKNLPQLIKPKRRFAFWYSGVAAVALILVMISLILKIDNKQFEPSNTTTAHELQKTEENNAIKPVNASTQEANDKLLPTQSLPPEIVQSVNHVKPVIKKKSSAETEQVNAPQDITPEQDQISVQVSDITDVEKANTVTSTDKTKTQKIIIDKLPDLSAEEPVILPKSRKKEHPLIAASFSTGNIAMPSSNFSGDYFGRTSNKQLVSKQVYEKYDQILNAADYQKIKHLAPISVGLVVAVPIYNSLSIESGMTYTYLRSLYETSGNVSYNGELELHYMGIPLNLRYKVLNKRLWNLYVSGGAMIEKGLRSIYNQEIEEIASIKNQTTIVKSSIEGFQWSVNGAVGIDINIGSDVSFFVEPKISYYLENNQPMSARTEQPLILGINGGFRFEL